MRINPSEGGYVASRIALTKQRESSPLRRNRSRNSIVIDDVKDSQSRARPSTNMSRRSDPMTRPSSSLDSSRNGKIAPSLSSFLITCRNYAISTFQAHNRRQSFDLKASWEMVVWLDATDEKLRPKIANCTIEVIFMCCKNHSID